MRDTYQPEFCTVKCQWLDCYAGLGLAGRGRCFAGGAWWMPCCPEFQDQDEWCTAHECGEFVEIEGEESER